MLAGPTVILHKKLKYEVYGNPERDRIRTPSNQNSALRIIMRGSSSDFTGFLADFFDLFVTVVSIDVETTQPAVANVEDQTQRV